MNAPKPISISTQDQNDDDINLKMVDVQSYDVNIDNKKLNFEFAKSENKEYIIFKISDNNLIKKTYFLKLNIDGFYNLNIIFKFHQNIDEVYSFLLDIIEDNKYSIKLQNDIIILSFQYQMPGRKIIDINFELKEYKINEKDLIQKLYSIVEELSKENKKIKEEFKNKNDEFNKVKNKLKIIEEENDQIKKRINKIEEYINNDQNKNNNIKKESNLLNSNKNINENELYNIDIINANDQIQKKNNKKLDMDLIQKIREEYGKDFEEFSDEKIQKELEENDYDFQKTVMELMLRTTKYELKKK